MGPSQDVRLKGQPMGDIIKIGDVSAAPGEIRYGHWHALAHPTGHVEFFPVIIAQGRREGPCFWLTAGVHGSEQAGPLVLYELLTRELVARLKGTVVAIPALNPAGLRTGSREPYHAQVDPNRLWPETQLWSQGGSSIGEIYSSDPISRPEGGIGLAACFSCLCAPPCGSVRVAGRAIHTG